MFVTVNHTPTTRFCRGREPSRIAMTSAITCMVSAETCSDAGFGRIEFPAVGSANLVAGMYQDRCLALFIVGVPRRGQWSADDGPSAGKLSSAVVEFHLRILINMPWPCGSCEHRKR